MVKRLQYMKPKRSRTVRFALIGIILGCIISAIIVKGCNHKSSEEESTPPPLGRPGIPEIKLLQNGSTVVVYES